MAIVLDERQIKTRMNNPIRKLLSPISSNAINAASDPKASASSIIIGVKGPGVTSSNKYTDWRFKTKNPEYTANYTEIWAPNKDSYVLQNAYLSIFDGKNAELIALHCDPQEPRSSAYYKYKCGPHIHLSHTISRIKKAHIALYMSDFETIVSDLSLLDNALKQAIQMIADELI